jgi:putative ABC transport system permease protein
VGVLEPQGVNFAGEDEDRQVFIPLEAYRRRIANRPWVSHIYLQLDSAADSAGIARMVQERLRQRHGRWPDQVEDAVVKDFADLVARQADVLTTLSWMVALISAILVIMGAVGIATLMLLVVRERWAEIGLRRALGATPADVGWQFFAEGMVLSATGVLAGLLLGGGLVWAISRLLATPVGLDPVLPAISMAISLGAGALACAIPALLAARLEPSDALRA